VLKALSLERLLASRVPCTHLPEHIPLSFYFPYVLIATSPFPTEARSARSAEVPPLPAWFTEPFHSAYLPLSSNLSGLPSCSSHSPLNLPSPYHVIIQRYCLSQSLHLENNECFRCICATLTKDFRAHQCRSKCHVVIIPGYSIVLETCNRYFRANSHILKATSRLTVVLGGKGCGSKKLPISALNPKRCIACQGLRKLLSHRFYHHICTPRSKAPTSCGLWIFPRVICNEVTGVPF